MSNFLERFTLIQKLLLLLVTFTLCVVAIVLSASATISLVRIGGDLQTAITKDADLLGDLVPPALGLEEAHDAVLSLRISTEATAQQRGFAQLQHAQERFQQAIAMWEKDPHEDAEQQQIMGPIRKTAEEFYALALGDYSRAVQNFDTDRIAQLGVTLDTIHQRQDVALEKLADEVLRNSRAYRHEAATQTSASISRTYWIAGGGLLLAGGIFVLVLTSIRRQIGGDPAYARDIMRRVLEGETELQLQLAEGDRDSLMASISRLMQSSVENWRLRSALNNVTANVMVADNAFNIVYCNPAVMDMFQSAEADIRTELPQFRASEILGGSIDRFHKNPAHQRGMLERLSSTYSAQIQLGGRTLTVVANPVLGQKGQRLGAVVEWQDITEQLAIEQKAAALAAENSRVRSALDNVTANVMIADRDFNIVYCNEAVMDMFRTAEADIRTELPQFRTSEILGGSIDRFHKNPAHQRGMLEKLSSTYRAQINLGGRTLTVVANPVMGVDGQRLGAVVEWQDITVQLAAEQKAASLAAENARVRSALDNVTTNVMIADNDRNIIYMNKTVTAMLQNAEADLRKALPNFDVNKLLGGTMDQFHRNPEHQKQLLAKLTNTYRAQIEVSGRTFALIANPVMSSSGERIGSVVEWNDRTLEVAVEREVAELVNAAGSGNFTLRIEEAGKSGFFLNLATGLNQLMATADKGLNDVARVLGAIAQGDLTQRIEDEYRGTFGQLKDFSNETSGSLSRMLGQIREAADTIYTASNEISVGNNDLSSRTEEQASSLEETASSMEELTSTVKLNADNARQANSLAVNASEVAVAGGNVVEQVVQTMASINDSARKIADIIGVIDGIAFQTNILALNAAVEAARAGEQGRGFAVVAGEVRTLAQRSAAAAKEIKSLISDSVDKVDNGNHLVAQAGKTMSEIVVAIKRVTDIMAEIAAASAEQSNGIEEINGAVNQMDEMTQQNAALVEQAAASAESLLEQASSLSQAVAVFKFEHAVGSGLPAPHAAKPPLRAVASSPRPAPKPSRFNATPSKAKDEGWEEF